MQRPVQEQGRQAPILKSIRVEGAQRYTENQLVAALGQKIGQPIDPPALERGVEVLWKAFHVRARVALRPIEGGVELRLQVVELPVDLEPRFVGNNSIGTKKLREWALIEEKSELFIHEAPRVRQRLLENYLGEGFYFVEIEAVARGGEGSEEGVPPDVIFEIREGPKVRVDNVYPHGNYLLPDTGALFWKGGLRHLSKAKVKSDSKVRWWFPLDWINPFRWLKGKPFVLETLEEDLLAMRSVYRDRGWLDAVVELERMEFNAERDRVDLYITIDEGERYTVASLDIKALKLVRATQGSRDLEEQPDELLFSREELLEMCELKPGEHYELVVRARDRVKLRSHYGEQGYLQHPSLDPTASWRFLDPELRYDLENRRVHVIYRIVQGRQQFIREVFFSGDNNTRDRVMRREVSVLPGELAKEREIQKSLGRLADTGFFTHPTDPQHSPPSYRFLPTDDPDWVNLDYELHQGRDADFNFGGSVSSDGGVAGFVTFTIPNFDIADPPSSPLSMFKEIYRREAFRGAGQRLELALSPGSEVDFWLLRFIEPDLTRSHFDPWSLDLTLQRRDRRFRSHDEEREEITPRIGHRFGDHWSVTGTYTNQSIDLSDLEDDEPIPGTLARSRGTSGLIGGGVNVSYRDLDSVRLPREGFRVNWKNDLYGTFFGGNNEFVKSDVRFEWYKQTGDPQKPVRPGYKFRLRGGVADPFGDSDEVTYSERFFLGGTRSLRGFSLRGVGPTEGTDFAAGGQTYASSSFEYRIPLKTVVQPGSYRERELIQLVLFTDWGLLNEDSYRLDFDELRGSVGIGFGIVTPIAPLRFDFGFPVKDDDDDDTRVLSFSFGR